jgi:hypothetical protein
VILHFDMHHSLLDANVILPVHALCSTVWSSINVSELHSHRALLLSLRFPVHLGTNWDGTLIWATSAFLAQSLILL